MRPKNSPIQQPRTAQNRAPQDLHAALMAQALQAYSAWLDSLLDLGVDQARVGSKLIAEIAEIRRQHYADASTRVSELLVVHAKLSTLWFERQHKEIPSGTSPPEGQAADYERLLERQRETIAELRSACGLRRRSKP